MFREDNRFFFSLMLLLVLGILGYLTYHIIAPFLVPIAWAVVFSIVFYPVYMVVLGWVRIESLAALATLAIILLLILGPVSSLGYMLVIELGQLAQKLQQGGLKGLLAHPSVRWVFDLLQPVLTANNINLDALISKWIATIRAYLAEAISVGARNVLRVIFDSIVIIFSTFFLLKDGPHFIVRLRDYLPFSEDHKDRLISQAKEMVVSTIYGGVVVAAVQGLIAGLAFWTLGFSSPIFWGGLTFMASFAPFVGTAVIWLPGAIYLFLSGQVLKGTILLGVGIFIIGIFTDYFLRPLILKGRIQMNTLLILFSVFGGIEFFGIIGLVLGPLTLALFISVLEIFGNIEGDGHAES